MKMEQFKKAFKGNVEFGKDVIGIEVLEPVKENGDRDLLRHCILNVLINSNKILSLYDWKDDILYGNNIEDFKIFQYLNIVYPINSLIEKYSYELMDLSGDIIEIDTDILNSPIYLKNALEDNIEDEKLKNDILKYTNLIKISEITDLENTKYYAKSLETNENKWHDVNKIEILYVISSDGRKPIFMLYDKSGNIIENNKLGYSADNNIFKEFLDDKLGKFEKYKLKQIKTSINDLLVLRRWYNPETEVLMDSYINSCISQKVRSLLSTFNNDFNNYDRYKIVWEKEHSEEIDDEFAFETTHDEFTKYFPGYKHILIGDSSNYIRSIKTEDGKNIYVICVDTVDNFSLSKELLYTVDGRRLLKCNKEVSDVLNLTQSQSDVFIKIKINMFSDRDRYEYYIDIDNTKLNPYALEKIMEGNTLSDHDIYDMKYIIESYERILKDTIEKYNDVLNEEK